MKTWTNVVWVRYGLVTVMLIYWQICPLSQKSLYSTTPAAY